MKTVGVILILALTIGSSFSEKPHFGTVQNVHLLDVKMESDGFTAAERSLVASLDLETSGIGIFKTRDNYDCFHLEGIRTNGIEGQPLTYVKAERIELDQRTRITGVRLISGEYVEIRDEIRLAPEPAPLHPTKTKK
ncbi:MAG: hypothetical protein JSV84_09735, partial [Gemmatimonadota bacterium]